MVETASKDFPNPEAIQRLIKARRSRYPKDYTGETFDRYPALPYLPFKCSD